MTTYLDGNVLGGVLGEMFTMDMTTAMVQCGSCGSMGAMGETRVYADAPGMVARCATCDEIVMRVVHGPGRAWLDLSGMRVLQLQIPEDA
jgi:hypothetical protein